MRLPVSGLILTLLPGCSGSDYCNKPKENTTITQFVSANMFDYFAGDDGVLSDDECKSLCSSTAEISDITDCEIVEISDTGTTTDIGGDTAAGHPFNLSCTGTVVFQCYGRPPRGLVQTHPSVPTIGAWAAYAASMEAASVCAFRDLDRALERFAAPLPLRRATRRAARDEIRHTRMMAQLATAHGVPVVASRIRSLPPVSRTELALENAVSGCVQETWSALMARHQALYAPDVTVRETMGNIAEDEAFHADLAWAIHDWLAVPIPRDAIQRELDRIRTVLDQQDDGFARSLGLPTRIEGHRLLDAMGTALWDGFTSV